MAISSSEPPILTLAEKGRPGARFLLLSGCLGRRRADRRPAIARRARRCLPLPPEWRDAPRWNESDDVEIELELIIGLSARHEVPNFVDGRIILLAREAPGVVDQDDVPVDRMLADGGELVHDRRIQITLYGNAGRVVAIQPEETRLRYVFVTFGRRLPLSPW